MENPPAISQPNTLPSWYCMTCTTKQWHLVEMLVVACAYFECMVLRRPLLKHRTNFSCTMDSGYNKHWLAVPSSSLWWEWTMFLFTMGPWEGNTNLHILPTCWPPQDHKSCHSGKVWNMPLCTMFLSFFFFRETSSAVQISLENQTTTKGNIAWLFIVKPQSLFLLMNQVFLKGLSIIQCD